MKPDGSEKDTICNVADIKIFDTHAHYDDEQFNEDRAEVFENIRNAGVLKVVNIGCNMKSSKTSRKLSETVNGFYGAVGIHPSDADEFNEDNLRELRELALGERIVAIGEIGLDYYWDDFPREIQREAFEGQLKLARELDMPVVIHCREAAAETFEYMKKHAEILKNEGKSVKGVIHCYSGSVEMAKEYVKLGYYIGVGGVLTFKNAKKLVEVVEGRPLDNIVIETDCPYLSPVPFRGKRNDSANLIYVIEKISEITGKAIHEVAEKVWNNAHRLYELKQ